MVPVLCATGVPAGSPAGIAVVELLPLQDRDHLRVRLRADGLARARASAAARERRAPSSCCSGPCRTPSDPRRRAAPSMPSAPSRVTVLRMFSTPSRSISRFAAKLLLTVIIASHSCAQRHRLADGLVDLRVGIVADAQLVDAAVDDAVELVLDRRAARRASSCPASAWRNSSIITGTFIVLAAWNGLSGSISRSRAAVERADTTDRRLRRRSSRDRRGPSTHAPASRRGSGALRTEHERQQRQEQQPGHGAQV